MNINEETNSKNGKDLKSQIKFKFGCTTDFNLHLIKNWFRNHPEMNKKA